MSLTREVELVWIEKIGMI